MSFSDLLLLSCQHVTKHLIYFIVVIVSPQDNVICAVLLHVIIHEGTLIANF